MALSKALEEDFFLVTYWIEFNYKITKNQVLKALKAIILIIIFILISLKAALQFLHLFKIYV